MGAYGSFAWIAVAETNVTSSTMAFQGRGNSAGGLDFDGLGRPSYKSVLLIFESPSHFVPFRVNPANPLLQRIPRLGWIPADVLDDAE